jgi:hypothetical protein
LDHAIHELARLNGATGVALDETEFVIAETESWYRGQRTKRLGAIGGALAFVDELQPYLGVDADHPLRGTLRKLHQLARIDRHRHIHVAQMHLRSPTIVVTPAPGLTEEEARAAIAAGDIFKMNVNVNLPLYVCLDEPELVGVQVVSEVADEIERGTGTVLRKLADYRPPQGAQSPPPAG